MSERAGQPLHPYVALFDVRVDSAGRVPGFVF
jgi:hypothetical protein